MSSFRYFSFTVVIVVGIATAASAVPMFMGLGDLPGGPHLSQSWGISGDGSTVVGVGMGTATGQNEPFIWTLEDGMVGLGGPLKGRAPAASADGSVAVGETGGRAFRTAGTSKVTFGGDPSAAWGISADASVIVGVSDRTAFRWSASDGLTDLGSLLPSAPESIAYGVSGDGSTIVGQTRSSAGREAFVWTSASGMVGLGDIASGIVNSEAWAISLDGSTVVGRGALEAGDEAFRWTLAGGMVGLGDLPGGSFHSEAFAVSSDGSVIVGSGVSFAGQEAFIWTASEGIRSLAEQLSTELGIELTGWALTGAYGVSADGMTIVGHGVNPEGNQEAWIAIIPEPSTILLLASGLAALALRPSRKAR